MFQSSPEESKKKKDHKEKESRESRESSRSDDADSIYAKEKKRKESFSKRLSMSFKKDKRPPLTLEELENEEKKTISDLLEERLSASSTDRSTADRSPRVSNTPRAKEEPVVLFPRTSSLTPKASSNSRNASRESSPRSSRKNQDRSTFLSSSTAFRFLSPFPLDEPHLWHAKTARIV